MDLGIKGQVALVTGAGRGIGKAIAEALAQEGARLMLCDKDEDAVRQACDALVQAGAQAEWCVADVARYEVAAEVVQAACERFGSLHILVNNAGFSRDAPLLEMTESQWDTVLDACLKSAWAFSQAAAAVMVPQRYGRILNIASRAHWGEFRKANYASAKAGMVGLTRALALELAPHEVTVNAIAPGLIRTERVVNLDFFEDIDRRARQSTPIQRPGVPEDIASGAAFLVSARAGFITGELLHITGGRYASQ